jgi:methanol metabolism-related c-type cytochrome
LGWLPHCFVSRPRLLTGRETRLPSKTKTANTTTSKAIPPIKYSPTAPSTTTPIPASSDTIPNATSHGPDGLGSSYAPAPDNSLKTISYGDFFGVVAGGRKNVNTANENVMPAFGTNKNVMCVIDDIYVYLRARANDAVPRGRPAKHEEKPEAAAKWQNSCFGQS